MKIETKYNVGDSVWIVYKNGISNPIITHLTIMPYENNINYPIEDHIGYRIKTSLGELLGPNKETYWREKHLFKTKEELIASL